MVYIHRKKEGERVREINNVMTVVGMCAVQCGLVCLSQREPDNGAVWT